MGRRREEEEVWEGRRERRGREGRGGVGKKEGEGVGRVKREVEEVIVVFLFFFFQAEDGIRDLVRSRGLGDVYKRRRERRTELRTSKRGAERRNSALLKDILVCAIGRMQ